MMHPEYYLTFNKYKYNPLYYLIIRFMREDMKILLVEPHLGVKKPWLYGRIKRC